MKCGETSQNEMERGGERGMEKGYTRGTIVISYSADKKSILSLIDQINDKTSELNMLARQLFDALQEEPRQE